MFASEDKLTLTRILKAHPALRSVTPRTLLRWTARGTRGVRLESVKVGGRTMSSLAAVDRFVNALNPSASPPPDTPRSPNQRATASQAAASELERAGA